MSKKQEIYSLPEENVTLPAKPKISPNVGVNVPSSLPSPSPPSPSDPLSDPQALAREVGAYMQQQGWDDDMSLVAEGIVKSRYLDDSAVIVIATGQCWSGAIMGSDNILTTWDGCGTGYHSIPCSGFFGGYSLAMQRTDENYGTEFLVRVERWRAVKTR